MRIALNFLHAMVEIGGGWNYIANLVSALGEYDDANDYLAFVTKESECLVPSRPNFKCFRVGIDPTSRVQRVIYENTWLQILINKYKIDCTHWFGNTEALINAAPGVITLHDMHAFRDFVHFSFAKRVYCRATMYQSCRRARLLLPISNSTAEEFQHFFGIKSDRIVVIPPIVSPKFRPRAGNETEVFRFKYRLPRNFWLYVAHILRYKNHLALLHAYHESKSRGVAMWPLVLRGDTKEEDTKAELMETISQLHLDHDVILLPRLREEDLPVLYSAATALIFPSLYEGAGIPVIEAMACGCPVVASKLPSVNEFAGAAASYFDPKDTLSITNAMVAFQTDSAGHEEKRRIGMLRAEEFRAQTVIKKVIDAYGRALRG
jgi:glycosyltransferase involved in cell wall biosynthesis